MKNLIIVIIAMLFVCVSAEAKHKPHWKKNHKAVHHKFHGLKLHKHKAEKYHRFLKGPKGAALPPSVDWYLKAQLSPVLNQQQCGSCYAFGDTGAANDVLITFGGYTGPQLSPNTFMCCGDTAGGCGGGDEDTLQRGIDIGFQSLEQSPYTESCRGVSCNFTPVAKLLGRGYVGPSGGQPTPMELATALDETGPMSFTVYANSDLENYDSGVFDSCSNGGTNHIVEATSYYCVDGFNASGFPNNPANCYWWIKNSWGATNYGMNSGRPGYFMISMVDPEKPTQLCSNIGQEASFVTVTPPAPGPTPPAPIPPTPVPPTPPNPPCHESFLQSFWCSFFNGHASYCCK